MQISFFSRGKKKEKKNNYEKIKTDKD